MGKLSVLWHFKMIVFFGFVSMVLIWCWKSTAGIDGKFEHIFLKGGGDSPIRKRYLHNLARIFWEIEFFPKNFVTPQKILSAPMWNSRWFENLKVSSLVCFCLWIPSKFVLLVFSPHGTEQTVYIFLFFRLPMVQNNLSVHLISTHISPWTMWLILVWGPKNRVCLVFEVVEISCISVSDFPPENHNFHFNLENFRISSQFPLHFSFPRYQSGHIGELRLCWARVIESII